MIESSQSSSSKRFYSRLAVYSCRKKTSTKNDDIDVLIVKAFKQHPGGSRFRLLYHVQDFFASSFSSSFSFSEIFVHLKTSAVVKLIRIIRRSRFYSSVNVISYERYQAWQYQICSIEIYASVLNFTFPLIVFLRFGSAKTWPHRLNIKTC